MTAPEPAVVTDFEGVAGGSQHRTVGPHRAWCHSDGQWCYPNDLCPCCAVLTPFVEVRLSFIDPEDAARDPQAKVTTYEGRVAVGVLRSLVNEWGLR